MGTSQSIEQTDTSLVVRHRGRGRVLFTPFLLNTYAHFTHFEATRIIPSQNKNNSRFERAQDTSERRQNKTDKNPGQPETTKTASKP
jgi:hypothetical protein